MLTIKQILNQYLFEQKKRLFPKTFGYYDEMVSYFGVCCNNYGDMWLEDKESKLFDKKYEQGIEFCECFGPEVLDFCSFSELVGYFIPRKVICGYDSARKMCSAAVNCYRWFCSHNYVEDECVDETVRELRASFKEGWQEFNKESCEW